MDPVVTPGVRIMDWNENRQRHGATSPVFVFGPTEDVTRTVWLQFKYEPGWVAPIHAHSGWTATIILEGTFFAGGVEYSPGSIIQVEPNVHYGPFETGPNGVTCLELFENQAALPPIWDESDPDVIAVMERLGPEALSIWNNKIV